MSPASLGQFRAKHLPLRAQNLVSSGLGRWAMLRSAKDWRTAVHHVSPAAALRSAPDLTLLVFSGWSSKLNEIVVGCSWLLGYPQCSYSRNVPCTMRKNIALERCGQTYQRCRKKN